jgi:hypothetical protein
MAKLLLLPAHQEREQLQAEERKRFEEDEDRRLRSSRQKGVED